MADSMGRDRDLVLAPGEFAYVLDTTKGLINVNVGPYKTSMAGTDQPVVFDRKGLRFKRVGIEEAIQRDLVAPEGFYLALFNPAAENKHPDGGKSSVAVELTVGHRVNIPGPANFALWPGQMADVIRGHHLRSNQYLLAQVYNDTEATANWNKAIVKPAAEGSSTAIAAPRSFTPGQLLVIKGTDVSFFIPPTGIKVVAAVEEGTSEYVRDAVTLERLEYCILLDEDGNKRFVQGPDVVFPEPTEKFVVGADGTSRKFKAIELNETTGIYVKVIADYEDGGKQHKAGDELFITGKEQAIYYQREEHSIIRYGNQTKHYAVAIPSGEGRYVLNRISGAISLVKGPRMLLCDPRTEVIVRRTLSERAVQLMYPGNQKALAVNRQLEAETKASDATQYEAGRAVHSSTMSVGYSMLNMVDEQALSSRQLAGDTFTRGNKFTPPRTITLDTKYEGAVAVDVWPGYAVNVVDKGGKRRVVEGPATVLLEYDESLAPLTLSTGTPKTDAKLLETVYLRTANNSISDMISAETKDFVPVQLRVAYRVNFDRGASDKWFSVENYIGLLTDHQRSMVRNSIKRVGIEEFYAGAIDIVRDTVLGKASAEGKRPGRLFDENGMRTYDVEVLEVKISNPAVASKLQDVQVQSITSAVDIALAERKLEITRRSEVVRKETAEVLAESAESINLAKAREIASNLAISLAQVQSEASVATERTKAQLEEQADLNTLSKADLERKSAAATFEHVVRERAIGLEVKTLEAQTAEVVKRASAMSPQLAAALTTFSDQKLIEHISQALAPIAAVSGVSAADVLSKLFGNTPFAGVMESLASRSRLPLATTVEAEPSNAD